MKEGVREKLQGREIFDPDYGKLVWDSRLHKAHNATHVEGKRIAAPISPQGVSLGGRKGRDAQQ